MKAMHYKKYGLCLLWFLIFCLRLIFLDSDLPPTGIINYQPIDEGAYSYLALNQINYGTINPDNGLQYTATYSRQNLPENLISYIGLSILGKNYYGLRIGSVICVLLSFFIIYKTLMLQQRKYSLEKKRSNIFICFMMFYLVFEFTFFIASRVNETSIYRLLFLVLTFYVFEKYPEKNVWRFFSVSFLITFSVTSIYITNIFLLIAFLAIVLLQFFFYEKKHCIISLVSSLGGILFAFTINEIYLRTVWNIGFVKNTLSTFRSFHSIEGYTTSGTLYKIIKTSVDFVSNNFSLYNIVIVFIFVILLPKLIQMGIKGKNLSVMFMLFALAAFYFQTLFSADFIRRKFIIVVPIIIYLIFIAFNDFLTECSEKRLPLYYKIYIFACYLFCICIIIYRLYITSDGSRLDFTRLDLLFLSVVNFIILTFILVVTVGLKWKKKYWITLYITALSVHFYMDIQYVFLSPTFSEKEIMVELNELDLEPKYIVGTYMLGYSLYNDYIPILNTTEKMKEILIENPEYYYMDYASDDTVDLTMYLEGFMEGTDWKLVEVHRFEREFQRYGHKRPIALYKVVPK